LAGEFVERCVEELVEGLLRRGPKMWPPSESFVETLAGSVLRQTLQQVLNNTNRQPNLFVEARLHVLPTSCPRHGDHPFSPPLRSLRRRNPARRLVATTPAACGAGACHHHGSPLATGGPQSRGQLATGCCSHRERAHRSVAGGSPPPLAGPAFAPRSGPAARSCCGNLGQTPRPPRKRASGHVLPARPPPAGGGVGCAHHRVCRGALRALRRHARGGAGLVGQRRSNEFVETKTLGNSLNHAGLNVALAEGDRGDFC